MTAIAYCPHITRTNARRLIPHARTHLLTDIGHSRRSPSKGWASDFYEAERVAQDVDGGPRGRVRRVPVDVTRDADRGMVEEHPAGRSRSQQRHGISPAARAAYPLGLGFGDGSAGRGGGLDGVRLSGPGCRTVPTLQGVTSPARHSHWNVLVAPTCGSSTSKARLGASSTARRMACSRVAARPGARL